MRTFEKIILLILLLGIINIGLMLLVHYNKANTSEKKDTEKIASAVALQDSFAVVAELAQKSVVVIKTAKNIQGYPEYFDPHESLYNYFYGEDRKAKVTTGQGSGFLIRANGYILTNFHIINNQDYFTVVLPDGREVEANIAGADPYSDLAVIKINLNENLPVLDFADTDRLQVGHWALAIGSPFSLASTVTAGIVSHKKRSVGMNLHENFIQTDASINPGNSGGPLLDLNGKVIGVNDFILSPNAGSIGLSFAIDGNLAKKIAQELIEKGQVTRPWLGVATAELNSYAKNRLGLAAGLMVTKIAVNSPAHKAGLRCDDIITEINGSTVRTSNELVNYIFDSKPGQSLKIKFLRNGIVHTADAVVTPMPKRLSLR